MCIIYVAYGEGRGGDRARRRTALRGGGRGLAETGRCVVTQEQWGGDAAGDVGTTWTGPAGGTGATACSYFCYLRTRWVRSHGTPSGHVRTFGR
jgi:hypothetical protein